MMRHADDAINGDLRDLPPSEWSKISVILDDCSATNWMMIARQSG
jgi:hypothetical protein